MSRDYDELDSMAEDAANQDRHDKRMFGAQLRNPDCRDPDHPGCSHCQEEEDDAND